MFISSVFLGTITIVPYLLTYYLVLPTLVASAQIILLLRNDEIFREILFFEYKNNTSSERKMKKVWIFFGINFFRNGILKKVIFQNSFSSIFSLFFSFLFFFGKQK